MPKAVNYRVFKVNFSLKVYSDIIKDNKNRVDFFRVRTPNHKLPGRWYNINRQTRNCIMCKKEIRDEFHFTLVCQFF